MFTNQKVLGILLIIFIIGTGIYFTVARFKQDVSILSATPSPTPQDIKFVINEQSSSSNQTPTPTSLKQQQTKKTEQQSQPQPTATELPLAKHKRLTQFPGMLTPESLQNKRAVIQTAKGIIALQIYPEASMAASNFMILAANGFYDGLIFHRVEDWVVQGGDPYGDGTGGPGYQFPDEPVTRAYVKGIVAMANSGPNTNGSQFFILKKDAPLQPNYTIFGQIISGQDVVERIAVGDIMQRVFIQNLQ